MFAEVAKGASLGNNFLRKCKEVAVLKRNGERNDTEERMRIIESQCGIEEIRPERFVNCDAPVRKGMVRDPAAKALRNTDEAKNRAIPL
tara:strand:+ start:186 stop:452 length:267 start_codon:yes stop_codon:yes gene_type:complete